jgi:hypothetical protein
MTPARTDTTLARCRFYRRVCGLPCYVHAETQRIILTAGPVGAVTMPEWLGGLGPQRPDGSGAVGAGDLASFPALDILDRPTSRAVEQDTMVFADLLRRNISIVPVGGEIALPLPGDEYARYHAWIIPPRDPFRPDVTTVVDAVLRCASGADSPC